ncbi:MAG: hypothetical protein ISS26_01750 [Candidatus Omnitrophica bacterium]|nr:hypothetical protein [Candidatus Omnitrophota bacterium]
MKKANFVGMASSRALFFWLFMLGLTLGLTCPVFADDTETVMDSADGSSAFSFQDNTTNEIAHIDTDGNMILKGGLRLDSAGVECTTAENLIIDGSVGIGTTSPQTKLDVQGAITAGIDGAGYDVKFYGSGSGKYLLWDASEDALIVKGGIVFEEVGHDSPGSTEMIDWGTSNKQEITLNTNCTLTFTAPHDACNLVLKIVQDATGGHSLTWPTGSTIKWSGGTAPTLTTDVSAIDIVGFYYDGTNYYGVASLNFTPAP